MKNQSALDLIEQRLKKTVNADERARLLDIAGNLERGWMIRRDQLERLTVSSAPQASMQSWRETLMATTASDTAVTTPASETVLTPGFTFPANYFYAGRCIKMTMWGMQSTVITTPGTFTVKLRAGVGGTTGTTLATSGAYAPDSVAASTQLTTYIEFYTMVRATGTAAASMTVGRMWLGDISATAATISTQLLMHVIPTSAPATVNIDTTAANTWSATLTPSVTTGTYTNLITILEALT
jgi:hypothetical protein